MAGKHHNSAEGIITGKMIVRKHLGEYCLALPGAQTESIEFLAAMNDYHEELLLEALNSVCKKAPAKTGHF